MSSGSVPLEPRAGKGGAEDDARARGRGAGGPSAGGRPEAGPPWVETRAGGMFFVNAILAAPIFMALYPWTLRWILRVTGILDRPSRVLDPVPAVAAHFAPVLGWLSLPAAWLVWKNLRIVDRRWARVLLWAFLAGHLGTFVYTLSRWI